MRYIGLVNNWRRLIALPALACAVAFFAYGVGSAQAAPSMPQSNNVAMVPNAYGENTSAGIMPTSGNVLGTTLSFNQFNFSNLALANIDAAHLAAFDTVVLNQVTTAHLSTAAKQALSDFVTNGGKLIIHDSDATQGNDYQWLPAPASTGVGCPGCGAFGGSSTILENNTLVSSNPADASYVNVGALSSMTDAVGDANVMTTQSADWYKDIEATNVKNETGAVHTYASVGQGLMIYNGYDTDYMGTSQGGVDWLSKLWFLELKQQWNPDGLPHGVPVIEDNDLDLTDMPSDMTVNATSPAGAVVTYDLPTAVDEDLSTVTVACTPASGTTFAIGATTVTCTATDTDGDANSPLSKTFTVTVRGAADQLADLCTMSQGVSPSNSLAEKCAAAQLELAEGHLRAATTILRDYIRSATAYSGRRIPADLAAKLIAAAQQIIAVIGA